MKRVDLIRDIDKNGCVFVRSGANHDIYLNPRTGKNNRFRATGKLTIIWRDISRKS